MQAIKKAKVAKMSPNWTACKYRDLDSDPQLPHMSWMPWQICTEPQHSVGKEKWADWKDPSSLACQPHPPASSSFGETLSWGRCQIPILSSTGMLHPCVSAHTWTHKHDHIHEKQRTELHHANFNQTEGNDHLPLTFLQMSATDGDGLTVSDSRSHCSKRPMSKCSPWKPTGNSTLLTLSIPSSWLSCGSHPSLCCCLLAQCQTVKAICYLFSCTSLCRYKHKCS